MSLTSAAAAPAWTCPFCPLACDHLGVALDASAPALIGGDCPRASAGLAACLTPATRPAPEIDGKPCTLDDALAAAVERLRASRQPLLAGLGTDVAGARALYPLACACGAIVDVAGGDALVQGLRVLQDRGQFSTTLAEVRNRADLIVFIGTLALDAAPLLLQRLGVGDPLVPRRRLVGLGLPTHETAALPSGVTVESVPLDGDWFDTLSSLRGLVDGRTLAGAPEPLRALAEQVAQADYAVFVGAPAALPAPAALLVEGVLAIVRSLNRKRRAAALWLGGAQGAASVNQTWAWLSGLPVRSAATPIGLQHEPVLYGAEQVLADGGADLLLWVSSFDAATAPPASTLPLIALAHPGQATGCRRPGSVFIPVATPGIDADGHLFRTDGTVLMPLHALRDGGLPSVADVARRLTGLLA